MRGKRLLTGLAGFMVVVAIEGSAQVQNQIQIDPFMNQPSGPPITGGPEAFKDGKLYYNNVPSTPARGSVVKIIDSKNDTDYISKVYKLKTKGISAEVASYLRTTVEKAKGKVDVSVDLKTGDEYLAVTAPDYQLLFIEAMITQLDREGTRFYEDGTQIGTYKLKNRQASEIGQMVTDVLKSKDGLTYSDNLVNKIYLQDSPSYYAATIKYIEEFDVPPEQVRIEAQIVEIESDDDFNFGLALEAWKEGLPENVDFQLDMQQGANNSNMNVDPKAVAQYAAQSVLISGMRPKAMANFVNYLSRSGHAKVLSSPTVVALNGQLANISSLDLIAFKAYATPDTALNKQISTGVALTITPTIGSETLTLAINAQVNSLVGFTSSSDPIVNTRTTTANVVLKDGELFSLSGLRKDTITKQDERVPVLGYTPLLGYLFRHEIDVAKSSEIVVFLTPHKVLPGKGALEKDKAVLAKTKEETDAPKPSMAKDFLDKVILNKK